MFAQILEVLGFNKYIALAIFFAVLAAAGAGGYYYWHTNVYKQAQLAFDNKQLQQVISDQKERIQQLEQINKDQELLIEEATKEQAVYQEKLQALDEYLNSQQAQNENRPSSDIIKKTIEELRKVYENVE